MRHLRRSPREVAVEAIPEMNPTHELLLLGLVGKRPVHAYELYDFVAKDLRYVADLSRSTVYRLMEKLHSQGLLERLSERDGRRPERLVHKLTPKGRDRLMALVREQIAEPVSAPDPIGVALLFWDALPESDRAEVLRRRREVVERHRETVYSLLEAQPPDPSLRLVLEHDLACIETEAAWLGRAVASLDGDPQSGARPALAPEHLAEGI